MKGLRRDPERTELRALRRRIPLEGARILEVGCGDGRLTRRIAPVARAVAAIDSNEAFIARAKALTPASLRKKVRYGLAARPKASGSPAGASTSRSSHGLSDESHLRAWSMP
ncbi:MAG TPA: class I SAM-dependent methyltransferase [bacterium]|nr:class I SAM-dependent methyltransferase [bacterium]